MHWKIRKIDHGLYSTTIFLQIILSVTAGLSSYFWGLLSSSEDLIYAAKVYTRARISEERFLKRRGTPNFPVTVVTIHDHNVRDRNRINRRLLANIIRDVARFEPAVIGVDYILDRPGANPRDDARLLRVLRRESSRLVLARPLTETSHGFMPVRTRFFDRVMGTGASYGIVNVHHKRGENPPVVRETRSYFPGPVKTPSIAYPAFAFCLYLKYKTRGAVCPETRPKSVDLKNRHLNYRRVHPALLFNILPLDQLRGMSALEGARYEVPVSGTWLRKPGDVLPRRLLRLGLLRYSHQDQEYYFHRGLRDTGDLLRRLPSAKHLGVQRELARLWNSTYPPRIKDKIVIIGSHYIGTDLHHTVLSEFTHAREHGVMLHARDTDDLVRGRNLRVVSPGWNLFIIAFSILMVAIYTWRFSSKIVLLLFGAHMILYPCLNWALFLFAGIHYGTAWFVLGAIITLGLVGRIRVLYTQFISPSLEFMPPDNDDASVGELLKRIREFPPRNWLLLYFRSPTVADFPASTKINPREFLNEMLRGECCVVIPGPDRTAFIAWPTPERGTHGVHIARKITHAVPGAIVLVDQGMARIELENSTNISGEAVSRLMDAAGVLGARERKTRGTAGIYVGKHIRVQCGGDFRFRRHRSTGLHRVIKVPGEYA